MVDARYLGLMFDVVMPDMRAGRQLGTYLCAFTRLARAIKGFDVHDARADAAPADGSRPLAIMQLVHTGRQSMRGAGRAPWTPSVAPSAVPIASGNSPTLLEALLFNKPREMTHDDIHFVIDRFVEGAVLAERAGFDGIELHAAHGYLLSSFLNPHTNRRTDAYGGDAERRFRILREIIVGIRARVRRSFVVGVKLNASDYVRGGQTEDDALQNVRWLAEMHACDFVEISGGSYEAPSAFTRQPERTARREGFFIAFAQRCRRELPPDTHMRVVVTGGFRTRDGMTEAVRRGHADAIGIGRAAAVDPALPQSLATSPAVPDWTPPPAPWWMPRVPLAGAGWGTLWYTAQIGRVSRGLPPSEHLPILAFLWQLRFWS